MVLFPLSAFSALPSKHKSLLPFVQPAPDQGETTTCLFMASTGAMELIANRRNGITNPKKNGPYDLSEPWLIHQREEGIDGGGYFIEYPVHVFNREGGAVLNKDWPFNAWIKKDEIDWSAWQYRDDSGMKRVKLPKVKTKEVFIAGSKYATGVATMKEVNLVRETLVKYDSPILINYIDDDYWHVILIVGYDDEADGTCYEIEKALCKKTRGAFYVSDSDGLGVQLRDYDWFMSQVNAAAVVMETNPLPKTKLLVEAVPVKVSVTKPKPKPKPSVRRSRIRRK